MIQVSWSLGRCFYPVGGGALYDTSLVILREVFLPCRGGGCMIQVSWSLGRCFYPVGGGPCMIQVS